MGEDYEIAADGKNVSISGECNITVTGNSRLLTMGNVTQQIYGDYHLNVGGDMRVKVGKSMVQEILDQRKIKVGKNDDLTVGISQIHNIAKNCEIQVGADYAQFAEGNWTALAPTVGITGTTQATMVGIVTCDIMGATVGMSSALATKIASDLHINIASTTKTIAVAAGIAEGCGNKATVAKGMWIRTAPTIVDGGGVHLCTDKMSFVVSAPKIMLN